MAPKDDRFLRGKQIAFMIFHYFRVTGTHEAILDYSDLFGVTLHGDAVQGFDTRWDEVSLSIQQVPSDDMLESFYQMLMRVSDQLKTVLALYEREIERHNLQPNYQELKTMVKRCMDQKIRARNFEGRNERIETGVTVKARCKRKPVSVDRKQREC